MRWVRKLFSRLLSEFLVREVSTELTRYGLLPEFLVVEVVHGVGEKHWVGAQFIVQAFV